jgi:predicted rRNA methylase YqxC with S4 and FtsJ domains
MQIDPRAELIALVKPMFELGLATPPTDAGDLDAALGRAATALVATGWDVLGSIRSPVAGAHGAIELFVHARRIRRS